MMGLFQRTDREYLLAVATLVGTAIGAGIFGLPYVTARAGFVPVMAMILVLGIFTLYSNLMYGEIVLRTKQECGFVGYAEKYLGAPGRRTAALMSFFSLYASSLVYIILGGIFLESFFGPLLGGDEFFYATITFLFVLVAGFMNLRFFTLVESWMTALLLVVMFGVVFKCLPQVELANFVTYDSRHLFLPFGAILFSLSANIAVPDMINIMRKDSRRLKDAIGWGTVAYTLCYVLFIVAVLGTTGADTTEESFLGLSRAIGDGVVSVGFIFGFLTIITSYLVTNLAIKNILRYDYKLSQARACLLAAGVPYLIYLAGLRDFIEVISIAGSLAGGFFSIMIIIIFYRARTRGDRRPVYALQVTEEFSALMIFVFLLGIIYQFVYPS